MSDEYVQFDPVKDEPGPAYFLRLYGKCAVRPQGSMRCGADCEDCLGSNWRPLGVKSHEDLRRWHATRGSPEKSGEP